MLQNEDPRDILYDLTGFQWAPTLGGECYYTEQCYWLPEDPEFQWAPTLGGECYTNYYSSLPCGRVEVRFNGHPPLGVNATGYGRTGTTFTTRFNGHPTLGVNAT